MRPIPKAKPIPIRPMKNIRPRGESSLLIGAPPVLGKPVTTGKSVAVADVAPPAAVGAAVAAEVAAAVGAAVAAEVAAVVAVATEVAAAVVGVVDAARQDELVMMLLSRVTAPVSARARPFKCAPAPTVMDVEARMVPVNEVFVPRVAELTSRHHTLQGSPPTTLAVPDVISVDADLKTQTPDPLRVSVPDNVNASAQ